MKWNYSPQLCLIRNVVVFAILTLGIAVFLTGCDIAGLLEEEETEQVELPPESALPALEALFSVVQLATDSDTDDPLTAAYPSGMTVQAGGSAEQVSISLADCQLQPTSDTCLSGDFNVARTNTSSTATITYSGNATMSGCGHTSATVNVAATFPYDPTGGMEDDEPQELTGSITLDGTAWEFSAVVDALEAYQEGRTVDPLNVPCRARFFAVGLVTDRWTTGRGGTVVYSPDGEEWAPMWIDEDVGLTSIAAAADGSMVAVSAESIDWKPHGAGTIWHSTNGDDWTKVHTTSTGFALSHVAWSDGLWVAVGSGGALTISPDGRTWSDHFIPADDPENSVLWSIAPGEDALGNAIWVLAGGRRMDDGEGWYVPKPIWWYISHAGLRAGPIETDWTVVGMDALQDESGMTTAPQTFKAVTWDPGTGDWIGAPMGSSENMIVYWDGITDPPTLSPTPTNQSEGEITPMGNLEVVGLSVVADTQAERFYRFALEQYYGNGVIHRSIVDTTGTPQSWASRQMTTAYETPLFHVAAGPVSGSETARSVLISGGGDIWVSSDYGFQWIEVKRDWYGVRGLTYRP